MEDDVAQAQAGGKHLEKAAHMNALGHQPSHRGDRRGKRNSLSYRLHDQLCVAPAQARNSWRRFADTVPPSGYWWKALAPQRLRLRPARAF